MDSSQSRLKCLWSRMGSSKRPQFGSEGMQLIERNCETISADSPLASLSGVCCFCHIVKPLCLDESGWPFSACRKLCNCSGAARARSSPTPSLSSPPSPPPLWTIFKSCSSSSLSLTRVQFLAPSGWQRSYLDACDLRKYGAQKGAPTSWNGRKKLCCRPASCCTGARPEAM